MNICLAVCILRLLPVNSMCTCKFVNLAKWTGRIVPAEGASVRCAHQSVEWMCGSDNTVPRMLCVQPLRSTEKKNPGRRWCPGRPRPPELVPPPNPPPFPTRRMVGDKLENISGIFWILKSHAWNFLTMLDLDIIIYSKEILNFLNSSEIYLLLNIWSDAVGVNRVLHWDVHAV